MDNREYRLKIYELIANMTVRHLDTYKGFNDRIRQNMDSSRQMDMIFTEKHFLDLIFTHTYNDTVTSALARSTVPQRFEKMESETPDTVVHQAYSRAIDDINKIYDEYLAGQEKEKLGDDKTPTEENNPR